MSNKAEVPLCRYLKDAFPALVKLTGHELKEAIIAEGYSFLQNLSPKYANPKNWFGMGPAPFKEMLLAPAYLSNEEPDISSDATERIAVYIITHTDASKR